METERHNTMPWVTTLSIVFFFALFLAYQYRGAIYGEMNALKLIPTPERFTELYFNDPTAIPTSTTAGQPLSFAFTIDNLEAATTTYPYIVYFEYPTGSMLVFGRGTVTLPVNASTSITISHTFKTSNINGKVVVDLTSLNNQDIDFLLPDNNI